MKEIKLAWLAGAWDGEGTFGMTRYIDRWWDKKRSKYRNENKLKPYIVLTNTNASFINEAVKILDENGITLHLYEKKGEKKNHKICYHLTSFNMRKIKALIELLLPYLVSKKAVAELLLRFVNSRIERMKETPSGISFPNYTEEELRDAEELMRQMKILNKKGENESSTTIRQTPKGDDIV